MTNAPRQKFPRRTPQPLSRMPQTDLKVSADDLDSAVFSALESVAKRIEMHVQRDYVDTRASLLHSMRATHDSIRRLMGDENQTSGPDALALVRLQLDRVLFALLLRDNGEAWMDCFNKLHWRFYALRLIEDRIRFKHHQSFDEYYRDQLTLLETAGNEIALPKSELEKLSRIIERGDVDPDDLLELPIAPSASAIAKFIDDPDLKAVAEIVYFHLAVFHEWAHANLGAPVFSRLSDTRGKSGDPDWNTYYGKLVIDSLPLSYDALVTVTTLFGIDFYGEEDVATALVSAWEFSSKGSILGIEVWDAWARIKLGLLPDPG